jgi:hypothetical protein
MHHVKYLNASIQGIKEILADKTNELESEQRRALAREIGKLKKLAKLRKPSRDEVYRVVSEVAETVSKILS